MKSKRIIILLIVTIAIYSFEDRCYSQDTELDTGLFGRTVPRGIRSIIASLNSDLFFPITNYDSNEYVFVLSPVYIHSVPVLASKLKEDSAEHNLNNQTITGNDFHGSSAGLMAGYAITDDWIFFSMVSGIYMSGKLNFEASGIEKGVEKECNFIWDGYFTNIKLYIGFGYDVINSKKWSLPIYAGIIGNREDFKFKMSPQHSRGVYQPYLEIKHQNIYIYDFSLGLALSYDFHVFDILFRITPYALVEGFRNDDSLKMKVIEQNPESGSSDVRTEYSKFGNWSGPRYLSGLRFIYISTSNLSFALSINGFLSAFPETNYYNDLMYYQLEMKYINLTVVYRGGFESEN